MGFGLNFRPVTVQCLTPLGSQCALWSVCWLETLCTLSLAPGLELSTGSIPVTTAMCCFQCIVFLNEAFC